MIKTGKQENMKEIVDKALLYDFYGPLLTEKQSKIWDIYYQQDFSLSEIAEEEGISRQAVFDLLKRTEKILEGYEEKLKLVSRFLGEKEKLLHIESLIEGISRDDFASDNAWKKQKDLNHKIKEIIRATLED